MELYEKLGFKSNPFSTFSAEEEISFLDGIFVNPLYINTLKSDITSGHSRFILGARGVGKTSLIHKLQSKCVQENIFSIVIDDFSGIKNQKNKSDLLLLLIEIFIRDYSLTLAKNPASLGKLNKVEKEKLAFFIESFFKSLSQTEYEKHFNRVTHFKQKNFFKNIYNSVFHKPINILISGAIEVVSDTVRNSFGLPDPNHSKFYKAYLPGFDIQEPSSAKLSDNFKKDERALKGVLEDLSSIVLKSGFGKPVLFFDKIDEYPLLSGNILLISKFIEDLLKDTTLLLNTNYSLVFSLWDAIKDELNSNGVRFDKIKPVNISWSDQQLRDMLAKRLEYFSEGQVAPNQLIVNSNDLDRIISLSSGSPRYLFRLLSVIYDQQNNVNSNVKTIQTELIEPSLLVYCKGFEFYAVFPGKRGTKDDVMTSVNRLLRVGKTQVTTKDFIAVFKVSSPTGISYIKAQQGFGLVEKVGNVDGKTYLYEVQHPVIKFLIQSQVTSL